jgi:serine/threonine-protein kinase
MPTDVGQIVAKKYELVRLLGRGSMGEVWSAHHQALREHVAIKLLSWPPRGEDAEDPSVALERFRFEAQVAARLSRKTRHIARVTDYGEDDGQPYIVMELLDGEALDAALRSRGVLGLAEAADVLTQIARALSQAHAEGVAHRDLKPANVFLTRDEDGRLLVKLLDFGIARTIHARRLSGAFSTDRGFVFGTPGYMSPEQTRASPRLDHRCDLWALSTIAYQMLTGHLPVEGNDAEEVMKNVCAGRIVPLRQRSPRMPVALDAFFERAFADRLDDRFEGAASLAQAFDLACGGGTSGAMIPPSMPSISEHTGNTATEFSSTLAGDALRAYHQQPAKVAFVSAGAVVGLVAVIVGLRSAWSPPPAHPPVAEAPAAAEHAPATTAHVATAAVATAVATPAPTTAWTAVAQTAKPATEKPDSTTAARRAAADHGAAAPTQPPRGKATPEVPAAAAPTPAPAPSPAPAPRDRNDVF